MNKLRKKSMKTTLPLSIFLAIAGIVMIALSLPSITTGKQEPIPWEEVDFEGDIEGLYVSGTLNGIYDWYCENTTDGRITSKEYIIDADDTYYMGMLVLKKDMDDAEDLMDVSWDYLDGYATEEELEEMQYEITGIISPIPTDSLHFYNEYIDWVTEADPTARSLFLPYYIEVNKAGAFTVGGAWALAAVGVVFVAIAVLLIVLALNGFYQKSIKKYIAASASPNMTAERIERFFANTKETNGMYYNNEFVCGQHGSSTVFGETSKIAWVYTHVTKHKSYFITISKTYELVICFVDGTRHFISMKNEAAADLHLHRLGELCPQAIFGYTDELNNLFNRSLASFLNLRYNQQNTDPDATLYN